MDYLIEVRAWSLGYDEVEELAEEIADVLVRRGLGLHSGRDDERIRAIVSVKPQGGMEAGNQEGAERVLRSAARGSQMVIVPSRSGMLIDRPGLHRR